MSILKIWLIFKREYISRVKNKIFWLVTLLAPLGIVAITLIPVAISYFTSDEQSILINDQSGYFSNSFSKTSRLDFKIDSGDLENLKQTYEKDGYDGLLYIPKIDIKNPEGLIFYSKNPLGFETRSAITQQLNQEVIKQKLILESLDPDFAKEIDKSVNIKSIIVTEEGEKAGSSTIGTMIGYAGGMIIYIVLLVYGSLVMQGVLEEKNSRVVEILISSVKPFELMMGKILGIAMVGLTQFLFWIMLGLVGFTVFGLALTPVILQNANNLDTPSSINSLDKSISTSSEVDSDQLSSLQSSAVITETISLINEAQEINFAVVIIFFLIYFMGGYLLYASLFAAIGSAINSEREGSALMLPVMMPIIVSIMILFNVTQNPHGDLAIWASMIPFTSPIIMLSRIPFDVPWWQLLISVGLLYGGFVLTTLFAAKIYRVGILSYGIKPSYRDLWKWLKR
jgi:ABC-2 type transport system permease protein